MVQLNTFSLVVEGVQFEIKTGGDLEGKKACETVNEHFFTS